MGRRTVRFVAIFFLLFSVFAWSSHPHFEADHDHEDCPLCVVHALGANAVVADAPAPVFDAPFVLPVLPAALFSGPPLFVLNLSAPPTAPPF